MSQDNRTPKRIAFVLNALTLGELKCGNYDVSTVYSILRNPNLGACDGPAPVHECSSLVDFVQKFTCLLDSWNIKDQLIFYFSGHGEIRRGVYGLILGPEKTHFYPFDNILKTLESSGVNRAIIILDACHSGAAAEGVNKGSINLASTIEQYSLPKGRAIIASSRATEVSQENPDGKSSVFTELLCQGIERGMDGEATPDGFITVGDIVGYITKKLESEEKYASFTQRPVFSVNASERDIWIAHNTSGKISDKLLEKYPSIKLVTSLEELQWLYDNTAHTEHPCPNATIADLDWNLVKSYAEALDHQVDEYTSREQLLSAMKFYSAIPYQGQNALHKSAVLCFSQQPETMYPQARSIFVIGNPRDERFVREDFTGPLCVQVDSLVKRIIKEFTKISIIEGGLRFENLEIDETVVRELISNALVHRDYGHKSTVKVTLKPGVLEIQSPGIFPSGLDWNSFLENPDTLVSVPVNGAIAHYMSKLLAFEGMGRGFDVIKEYIAKNGQDSIQFSEVLGPSILIKVKRRKPNELSGNHISVNCDRVVTQDMFSYHLTQPSPIDAETATAAYKQLAEMPVDYIPKIAPLPRGSRIPYSLNPKFVGREKELIELARLFKGDQTTTIGQIVAAIGLGGIGKTQLACEFAHRYGSYFSGGIFWLSFADPESIAAEVAQCGGHGNLDLRPDFASLPLTDQVRLVLTAWQSPLPRLLIFDNCEEEELLSQWRPPSGGCRILVTSRRSSWNPLLAVQPLPLQLLPRPESIALLHRHCPDLSESEADAIARELGDLPLALTLGGSFLYHYRNAITPSSYLSQLQNRSLLNHPSLQGRGASWSPTGHELHVGRTFALSYDRLSLDNPTDSLALALLARMACLAPGEPVPRDLLLATLKLPEEDPETALSAEDALSRLTGLSLVEKETGGALILHRLLQKFVFQFTSDPQAREAVEVTLLDKANRLNKSGDPRPLLPLQPHLRAVVAAAWPQESERVAGLCNTFGFHLNMIGNYPAAQPYFERALAIWEKILGGEHPNTARSLNNLGSLLQDMGDLDNARLYFERALAIWEKIQGDDHPNTAGSLNNLGSLLQAMGDLNGARSCFERALAIWEKVLGAEHPNTAIGLNNIGLLSKDMGDLEGARPYLERALVISERTLGCEHPDTATSLNNLGMLLQAMGDLDGARPYFEQALAIWEKVLGSEHPNTATSLNNLGSLLHDMGNLDEARTYIERAVAIKEKVLGGEHSNTAQSIW